jgi:hypothetical protein
MYRPLTRKAATSCRAARIESASQICNQPAAAAATARGVPAEVSRSANAWHAVCTESSVTAEDSLGTLFRPAQQRGRSRRGRRSGRRLFAANRSTKLRRVFATRLFPRAGTSALIRWCLAAFALLCAEAAYAQFTSTPVTTATVGQPYVYQVVAAANTTVTAPFGLPAWLTLQPSGNTATLSGTPTDTAPAPVYLQQQDILCSLGFSCFTQEFTIVVSPPNQPPVLVTGIPDQSINENQTLSLFVRPSFSDPDGEALTFAATGLPAGFTISSDGLISGAATLATAQSSPYNVTVTASDGRGGSVADAFVLTVQSLARFDLSLTGITATPSPAARGAAVNWVVTVANSGPSPSSSVDLTIDFAGTPVTFTTNPCTLTVASDRQRLACTMDPIASGGTQTVTVTGSAAQPGDVYVNARVSTTAVPGDPNANNNAGALGLNVAETIVTDVAQSIAVGAGALAAGDLNGDSYADAVIVKSGESPSLLLDIENPTAINSALAQPGDQRRGFASLPLAFGTGNVGADAALADFDNDTDLDVVIANGAGASSAAFRNDGKAVLTSLATLGDAARVDRAVAVADLTGDGFVDVVIGSATANTLYTNQNGATFAAAPLPTSGGAGAIDIVLADVVGTTLPDLIFVYPNTPGAVRYENLGGGTFGAAAAVDAGPVSGAASADFNRDGRADLVLARAVPVQTGGVPSNPVYLNNNAGAFVAVGVLGATPTSAVLAGDLNGDGLSDVVSINDTGAHQLFVGDGNGNFQQHSRVLLSRGATRGALAPIGRMKRTDLVLAGAEAVEVFFNDGRGNFGVGDSTRPVIQLNGVPDVSLEAGAAYTDQGATATDDVDGTLTPTVTNGVNPAVIGTYTVSFAAMDSAGNAAAPVARTVRVNAAAAQGGGGGAIDPSTLLLLGVALLIAGTRRSRARKEMAMKTSTDHSSRRAPIAGVAAAIVTLGAALGAVRAEATELSYTYIDFGGLTVDSELVGTKVPAATQQVRIGSSEGDGLTVSGSLALGRSFYLSGGYDSAVVDVDAAVTSPLATAMTGGNFDLVTSRAAFGYYHPIGTKLDVFAEVSYDTVEYDFGSFAGESFDVDEAGAGYGVGLRFSASETIELFAAARSSSIGTVDLTTSTVDTGTQVSAGLRVYFFQDLGLGFDLRSGDVDSLTVSMRFGFGELRAGRN